MKDDVDLLIDGLNSSDKQAQIAAAKALGRIRDPRSVEPLIRALSEEDSEFRASSIKGPGETRTLELWDR